MAYGTVKVDTVTFTYNAADATTTFSGFYASTTNNLTLSGTASANTFTGTTANFTNTNAQNISVTTLLSGLAITGGTAGFTIVTGTTVTGTTANFVTVSGTTVTGTTAQFTSITGGTAGFTTITGTTVTGTTANFVTVSGTTVTGTTASFTSGIFTSLSGTTHTITSGVFALGTAALPSISFVSDPNTGIYSPGADQVAVATNGTGRLFVDANGSIGVGTSSPTSYGSGITTGSLNGSAGSITDFYFNGVRQGLVGTFASNEMLIDTAGAAIPLKLLTNSAERARIRADGTFEIKGAGTAGISPGFSVSPSTPADSFVIDSSGRLGIGTGSPQRAVTAQTNSNGASLLLFRLSETNNDYGGVEFGNHPSDIANYRKGAIYYVSDGTGFGRGSIYICNDSAGDSNNVQPSDAKVVITSAGLVGIGTSSPGSYSTYGNKLVVYGTGTNGPGITIATGAADTGSLYFADGTTGNEAFRGAVQYAHADDSMELHTSGTVKVKITSAGLVGIGTTNPKSILTTQGNIVGLSATTHSLQHYQQAASSYTVTSIDSVISGASGSLVFKTGTNWTNGDAVEAARIRSDGMFEVKGAGTAGSSPAFSVNGSAPADSFVIDSSGRLGIGTSSVNAGAMLHIAKNTTGNIGTIRLSGNDGAGDGGAGAVFADNETVKWSVFTRRFSSANKLYISTTENDTTASKVTITEGGLVGIGSNSPQSLLHLETDGTALRIVRGSAIGFAYNTGTAATDAFRIQSNGGSVDLYSAASQPITFSAGTTEKVRIDSSGRLLVGTTTSPGGGAACILTDGYARFSKALGNKVSGSSYTVCTLSNIVAGKIKILSEHNSGSSYKEYSFCYSTNGKALSLIHDNSPYAPGAITLSLNNSTGVVSTSVLSYDTNITIVVECLGTTTSQINVVFP